MKSKLKLEQTKQMSLGDLQPAVCKQQGLTTTSTVLSLVTTKSETLGLTPIRDCSDCSVRLTESNTYKAHLEGRGSRCKSCWSVFQKPTLSQRMFVNGKYIPKSHPLHKAGNYKGFEEAAFSSLANYDSSLEGQVYIITNPAWEGWIKVGMAIDTQDRANQYQTSSPYRDYKVEHTVATTDRRRLESLAHTLLGNAREQRNEWFKCDVETAKWYIDSALGDMNEKESK